jgi:hypothetical protein
MCDGWLETCDFWCFQSLSLASLSAVRSRIGGGSLGGFGTFVGHVPAFLTLSTMACLRWCFGPSTSTPRRFAPWPVSSTACVLWRELYNSRVPRMVASLAALLRPPTHLRAASLAGGGWPALTKHLFFCCGAAVPSHFTTASRFSKTSGRSFLPCRCRGDLLYVSDPWEHAVVGRPPTSWARTVACSESSRGPRPRRAWWTWWRLGWCPAACGGGWGHMRGGSSTTSVSRSTSTTTVGSGASHPAKVSRTAPMATRPWEEEARTTMSCLVR